MSNSIIFNETHNSQVPRLSISIELEEYLFNYYTYGGLIDFYGSIMDYRILVLSMNNNQIIMDKKRHCEYRSGKTGNEDNSLDFKNYIDASISALVDELLEDEDFKKVLESAKKTETYTVNYEKISIAKISSKSDMSASIKSSIASTVTIALGGRHGSGAIISSDGLILTCSHVIGGNEQVEIILSNQVRLKAKVLRNIPEFDLALLQMEGATAIPFALGNSDKSEIGEDVWVVGTPGAVELGQSISKGIISGKRVIEEKSYLQTDASVSPGNSGGPILNKKGEIIGMVNAKVIGQGTEGLGFAIPINIILEKLNLVIK
jgi:S1-C subfamily serine protease